MGKINITVSSVGEVDIDAECFIGSSCEEKTKPIEDALMRLGGTETAREKKPEYYASDSNIRSVTDRF